MRILLISSLIVVMTMSCQTSSSMAPDGNMPEKQQAVERLQRQIAEMDSRIKTLESGHRQLSQDVLQQMAPKLEAIAQHNLRIQ
ncbi:MAG: hypothetical protein HQM12_22490 [SAR324 cluster bacterium]|nr:hypothetical protein [SAR324 cluster bacterium]